MSAFRGKFPWFGAALILIGATMLMSRFHVVPLGWHEVFWGLVAAFGAYKIWTGFTGGHKGSIFWGTLFFLFGIYRILYSLEIFELPMDFGFPAFVTMVGTGFFLMYISSPREWHLLVPALFFLVLGVGMGMSELGYIYRWEFLRAIKTYWPLVLILFGGTLLLNRRSA